MQKRLGVFATLFMALFAVIQPAAAQDRNDWNRGRFDQGRDHYANNYRPEPNFRPGPNWGPGPDWRARDFREEGFRDRAWREREFRERERERCERYGYGYGYRAPGPVVGFQFYGR